jgi:3-isopropylmalate dehydrogenase
VQPLKTVTGRAVPLDRADVDTDQIIPARHLKRLDRTGLGRFAFEGWRRTPGFPFDDPRNAGAPILVTGPNFGCGSSREHAPWALLDLGLRVVIAPSFADIFRANCASVGILTVTLPTDDVARLLAAAAGPEGLELEVDLVARTLREPGGRATPFSVDPFVRQCLLEGLDPIDLTTRREEAIARHERARPAHRPVTRAAARTGILCLPGDGIGPEVLAGAVRVLEAVGERFGVRWRLCERPVGAAAIERGGAAVDDETLDVAAQSDAILFGAVGDPRFDDPRATVRPEQAILRLRKQLGLFANLRPVRPDPALGSAGPLRPEIVAGTDLLIVRELTGGLYYGDRRRFVADGRRHAVDTMAYDEEEVRRVARLAFELARTRRRRVTSVDKANVLDCSRLWREVVQEVHAEFPEVELEHVLVDAFAMHLIRRPTHFDVVVTENLFGDVLSDEASVLTGSLGLMPSASLGARRIDGTFPGLYEPIHGSAPDIAGRDLADPIGAILAAALMLRWSLGRPDAAAAVEAAVAGVLAAGARTADLAGGGPAIGGAEMAERVAQAVARE